MRRKYLIDRNYQFRLILLIVILVAVATSASAAATFILVNREIGSAFYLAHRNTWDIREMLLPVITGTAVVTFLVVTVVSAVWTLRESHRVVGPVGRITAVLRDLARGKVTYAGLLRKDDVLKGLENDLNLLSENLAHLEGSLRKTLDSLKDALAGPGGSEPLSVQQLDRIRKCADEFGEALEFFHGH